MTSSWQAAPISDSSLTPQMLQTTPICVKYMQTYELFDLSCSFSVLEELHLLIPNWEIIITPVGCMADKIDDS